MNIRKRLLPIIYIVSIAVSAIIFSFVMARNVHDTEYTSYTRAMVTSEGIYFCENLEDHGLLYRLTTKGKVKDIHNSKDINQDKILAMSVYDGNLYVAYSRYSDKDKYNEGSHYEYCIAEFDKNLNLLRITNEYHLDDDMLSSISVEGSGIFTTTISSDGNQLKVVAFGLDKLVKPSEKTEDPIATETVMARKADPGRFFVSAVYSNGSLSIRTDEDEPLSDFAQDERISTAVSAMKLSAVYEFTMYKTYFIFWLCALLIWLIIVRLVYNVLVTSNRTMYTLILFEAILMILIGVSIYYVAGQYEVARKTERVRYGIISMESLAQDAGLTSYIDYGAQDYYDSENYTRSQKALADFVNRNGNSSIFYDVLIVRLSDGMVVTSASGRNKESLVYLFGNSVSGILDTLYNSTSMFDTADLMLAGADALAVGVADNDFIADYAIVGILDDSFTGTGINKSNLRYVILFIIIFAISSVILIAIYLVNTRDLKNLEDALRECALGRRLPDRPLTLGVDLKNMWDSLSEIGKRVDAINYKRFKIFEAYFRFSPKNIEYALGKESIMDVKNGEYTMLEGSLLTIYLSPNQSRDNLLSITCAMDARQKSNDCILVGNSTDLTRLQMLFMVTEKGSVDYAAEIIHDSNMHGGPFNSAFIFYDSFEFGIVGNDGLSLTYLNNDRSKELVSYGELFGRLHLGLVITEYIKIREYENRAVRYIGYIRCNGYGDKMKLYEVMDACGKSERHDKIHTLRQFSEALEMYEKKEFYFARNLFSDLLKIAPEDELSRWYLFESEKYLNEGVASDATFGALHM